MLLPLLRWSLLRPQKNCIPLRTSPKKSKKRQAIIQLLKIRSTPIALAARSADFFSPWIFQISIQNLSFRCGLSQKVEKTSGENTFSKNCIWLRTSPKMSKKTSSENITFENSEHPYRTSGPSAASFHCARSLFSMKNLSFRCRLSQKSRTHVNQKHGSSPMSVFLPKTSRSAAGCPKNVENASSENITFVISEHPYRTCGSSICVFFLVGSSPMSVFL